MGRIICWLNRSRSNAVTCQTKSWRLIVGLFCPTETSRFILFYFIFFKKKTTFLLPVHWLACLQSPKCFWRENQSSTRCKRLGEPFKIFVFSIFLNVSTCPDFFSDFFTFGRNLIRDIRTRSAHHPHLHQPPNWHLVVDRRPKKVEFWWLSLHQGCHSGTSNQAA